MGPSTQQRGKKAPLLGSSPVEEEEEEKKKREKSRPTTFPYQQQTCLDSDQKTKISNTRCITVNLSSYQSNRFTMPAKKRNDQFRYTKNTGQWSPL